MIDPKSLRIGNYIQDKKDGTTTILQVAHLSEGLINYWNASVYQPIPLSEQELIRLGFEKCMAHWEKGHSIWVSIGGLTGDTDIWIHGHYTPAVKISYVHQLQNLYYSLTGEELTYKVDSGLTPTEPDTKQ